MAEETLQEKAARVWREQQAAAQQQQPQRRARERELLVAALRRICGAEYEIAVRDEDEQAVATVDGWDFVSAHHVMTSRFAEQVQPQSVGVFLWWRCPHCRRTKMSQYITTTAELGAQLAAFRPAGAHTCGDV